MITEVLNGIRDFFVALWNDDEWYLCLAGLIVVLIMIYKILHGIFGSAASAIHSATKRKSSPSMAKVTIKGVYQMNGPKPFTREITCPSSKVGYYSQLMGNKSRQAKWIRSNFPGADTKRGFSMSINIK